MVGLLDLPLELREPILLDVVVDTIEEQPENTDEVGYFRGYRGLSHTWNTDVSCKSLPRHAMALLQINQQIRYEVIDIVLRRLGQRFNDAKVDVMYVQFGQSFMETNLFATWLSAPFPTTHLNSLRLQIRCFQTLENSSFRWDPSLLPSTHQTVDSGEDCQLWLGSENAALLLEFVRASLQPWAAHESSHECKRPSTALRSRTIDRTVQKLVIDIPFDSDPPLLPGARIRCMFCPTTNTNFSKKHSSPIIPRGKRAALIFAQALHEQLLRILDIAPRHGAPGIIPSIIFESVGTIELNVHGRLFRSLEMSRTLAKMPHVEEWDLPPFHRAEFFEWKREVEEKRRAAGFEVVKPSIQEHDLAGSAGLISSILVARNETLVPHGTLPITNDVPFLFQDLWKRPVAREIVLFTGNSVFVQEDGTKLSGDTTFYTRGEIVIDATPLGDVRKTIVVSSDVPFSENSWMPDLTSQSFEERAMAERPGDGEHVAFKGEAIFIGAWEGNQTIISGDATFIGRAEDASTEQPVSITVDRYKASDDCDCCDT